MQPSTHLFGCYSQLQLYSKFLFQEALSVGSRKDEANQFHRLKVLHLHLFHLYMCEAEDVTMESAEGHALQ